MTASFLAEAAEQLNSEPQNLHNENDNAPNIVRNGTTHSNGINENKTMLDNNQGSGEGELNGHHTNHGNNSINSQSIVLDNATV